MGGRAHTSLGTGTSSWHSGSLGSSIHQKPQRRSQRKMSRGWQGKARGFWKDEAAVLVDQGSVETPRLQRCWHAWSERLLL